jgi:hypothetical protein
MAHLHCFSGRAGYILGLTAAKPRWSAAIPVSVMLPASDPNQVSEADYVQGLAKLGIVKLSGHHPSPVVHLAK